MIQFHWVNFFLPHLGRFAEMPYYKERYWKESYFQALDEIEKMDDATFSASWPRRRCSDYWGIKLGALHSEYQFL